MTKKKNGLYTSYLKKWKVEMLPDLLMGKKSLNKLEKYKKDLIAQDAIIELQKNTKVFAAEVLS